MTLFSPQCYHCCRWLEDLYVHYLHIAVLTRLGFSFVCDVVDDDRFPAEFPTLSRTNVYHFQTIDWNSDELSTLDEEQINYIIVKVGYPLYPNSPLRSKRSRTTLWEQSPTEAYTPTPSTPISSLCCPPSTVPTTRDGCVSEC